MRLNTNNKVTFEDRHKNPITETLQSIETSSSLMECKKRSGEKARREGDGRERLGTCLFLVFCTSLRDVLKSEQPNLLLVYI